MALPLPVEPWPHGRYTVEDWLKLPEHVGERIELIDGSFVVSPSPMSDHQLAAGRLRTILAVAAPSEYEVLEGLGVQCIDEVPVPDVVIGDADVLQGKVALLQPYETHAVIEIVSQGNRRRDYQDKPRMYAAAGIPTFVRIELAVDLAPHVEVLSLREGRYVRTASAAAGERLTLTEPFAVTFDPAELAGKRRG